jgi:hypothetical protein
MISTIIKHILKKQKSFPFHETPKLIPFLLSQIYSKTRVQHSRSSKLVWGGPRIQTSTEKEMREKRVGSGWEEGEKKGEKEGVGWK